MLGYDAHSVAWLCPVGNSLRSIWVILVTAAILGFAWLLPLPFGSDTRNPAPIGLVQTLDRGLNGEPDSLDPKNFHSNQASAILRDIGEGLTRYDSRGNVSGGVASEWNTSSDGRIYKFRLRENARWSTGELVSAQDFVRAFKDLVDPRSLAKNALVVSPIKNARKIVSGEIAVSELGIWSEDPQTLVIELDTAAPHFLQVLTHPSTYPQYEMRDSDEPAIFPMVSNGPYKLVNRVLGSDVELVRNESYWNAENVRFEKVRYHIVDELAEFSRFKAKELDITGNVPSSVFEIAKTQFPRELRVAPYLGVYYYGFNLRDGALANNSTLRRALNLAIDREVLAEKVLGRGELPAYSWVPPDVLNYEPVKFDWHEISNDERIAMARRLLGESGYLRNSPKPLTLYFNSSDVQERIALAIQSMWKETLGIRVELVNVEFRVLISSIRTNADIDIFRLSWTADYNDPESFLRLFQSDDPANYTGYHNSRFDMLMRKASDATNAGERAQQLRDAEKILVQDVPVVPLYFYVSKHLVSSDVVGWTSNILDIHESQFLAPVGQIRNLPSQQ